MKAPENSGAFTAPAQQAAMAVIAQQGGDGQAFDCSPVHIARMMVGIFTHERDIRAWEDMQSSDGKRLIKGADGKLHWRPVKDLAGESLREARERRDTHEANIRQTIDYALTVDAYQESPCPGCRLPGDALGFIRGVADFEPVEDCGTCRNTGKVRLKKTDEQSLKGQRRITYFGKVVDDVILCAKIRAGTSDRHWAYDRLEAQNRQLLVKFGNEKQTLMEGADAEQGVRMGIIDAAMRFDPTRSEGAMFTTVAYNWCRRNSRARHDYQKRAGVYAPSVEAMGSDEDGNGMSALITESVGSVGTFGVSEKVDQGLTLDVAEKVKLLPDDERTVVELELTGHTVVQISRTMGVPTAKVRRLRVAAFEKLREGLVGYMLRE